MSWIDQIQSDLVIRTGDGKEYKPNWLNAVRSVDYNVSEFDFPNLEGTLVSRGKPRGTRFELTLFFQGDDHLDSSEAFRISANDNRVWILTHPFYGAMFVQPLSLAFDNTKYNVTQITGTVVETIVEDSPKTSINSVDKINLDANSAIQVFGEAFATNVKPTTIDSVQLAKVNTTVYTEGAKRIKLNENAEEYFNLFSRANTAVLNATVAPLAAINALMAVITYPALLEDSVYNRLSLLQVQFDQLRLGLANVVSPSTKKIYENNAGALITAMSQTSANPQPDDYGNRSEVYASVTTVLDAHNQYLLDLDGFQTDNGGTEQSYIPDADSMMALNSLVNYTVSNLFDIALNSKQERIVTLESDTNLILVAHRFYGIDDSDKSIDILIKNNNIGINEMLGVKKGRKIIYYI